jgi:nucleoside-diphosphate-sugar epimerase
VKHDFAAVILGGTGQVGGAAVAELLATSECREVVMITRKPIAPRSRVRNVVLDTSAADFAERTAAVARGVLSQGPCRPQESNPQLCGGSFKCIFMVKPA